MNKHTLGTSAEILHNLPYEAISVTVGAATLGTVTEDGRTILKAGALVAGDGGSIFANRALKVKHTAGTTGGVDGVILHDVDVTDGDAVVAMVYRGTLRTSKVNGGTEIPANAVTALAHIVFVNQ